MSAAMTGQRRRLKNKRQRETSTHRCSFLCLTTYITKSLLAEWDLTSMRSFAGMCSFMDSQSWALNEVFCATWPITRVRSFASMNTSVSCQIRAPRKGLFTATPFASKSPFGGGGVMGYWFWVLVMRRRMEPWCITGASGFFLVQKEWYVH